MLLSFEAIASENKVINSNLNLDMNKELINTLYGIINYTKWKKNNNESAVPINLCVVNECPVSSTIKLQKPDTKYAWWPNLIFLNEGSEVKDKNCDVLYFGSTFEDVALSDINLKNKNMLTISEHKDFIKNGGFIELKRQNKNVKFSINNEAIRNNNFSLDSELIQIGIDQ